MWRLVCLILAVICLFFAALGDRLTIGDTSINLFYAGIMFVVLSWVQFSVQHRKE